VSATTTPLPRKLGLTGEIVFTVRHAPAGFAALLEAEGGTGDAIWQQTMLAPIDVVIAFHTRRDALVAEWPKLTAPLASDGAVWVAWPTHDTDPVTGSPADLSADRARAALEPLGWVPAKSCTIDDTWSAARFERRQRPLRPKEAARARRGR
jgi:hypothetical protein